MAITISQDISGIYPAYNNSYIKFSSSISPIKAEIQPSDTTIFPNPFVLYPNVSGQFVFDFKELAKASFPVDGFEHEGTSTFDWGQSFLGNLATVSCTITTFSSSTSDTLSTSYQFSKSVRQIGEEINEQYLLTPQTDPLTYELSYWEGFPFNFQIESVLLNDEITVKNLNSGVTSAVMATQLAGGFAIHIDKVSTNWTQSTFLPLYAFLNRLEIYEEGVFKANLNIDKKEPCAGVYLRFFNNQGGINFHLFDEFYRDTLGTNALKSIAVNSFANVGSLNSTETSIGRAGSNKLQLKTSVTRAELKVLRQLYTSPKIEMYTSQEPYVQGEWVTVMLNAGSLPIETKKDKMEVTISIELPELNTLSL